MNLDFVFLCKSAKALRAQLRLNSTHVFTATAQDAHLQLTSIFKLDLVGPDTLLILRERDLPAFRRNGVFRAKTRGGLEPDHS